MKTVKFILLILLLLMAMTILVSSCATKVQSTHARYQKHYEGVTDCPKGQVTKVKARKLWFYKITHPFK